MVIIKPYEANNQKLWDEFVDHANNNHFMFKRNYMEYHSDRFQDFSLMIYEDQKLIALLPANIKENTVYSHQGLTFGGLIFHSSFKAALALEVFKEIINYLRSNSINKLIYKTIPYIYRNNIGEEDIYAISKLCVTNQAKLAKTDIHSVIDISNQIGFSKGKRSSVKKALTNNVNLEESKDYARFFSIMNELLENKYDSKATHNLEEILLLQEKFPANIKLFAAQKDGEMLAGTIIYETSKTVKTQYIASTEQGRELGAVDLLINELIQNIYKDKDFFDFGTSVASTEEGFNPSLMMQKELFGARAINGQIFEITI